MPNAVDYADGCLAGLNSEVPRQTVVIDSTNLSGSFVGEVIDYIAEHLTARSLRIQEIQCGADDAAAVITRKEASGGGLRGTAPVLVLEKFSARVDLVIVPVAKPREDFEWLAPGPRTPALLPPDVIAAVAPRSLNRHGCDNAPWGPGASGGKLL